MKNLIARRCENAYRGTFPPASRGAVHQRQAEAHRHRRVRRPVPPAEVLVLGRGNSGKQQNVLGAHLAVRRLAGVRGDLPGGRFRGERPSGLPAGRVRPKPFPPVEYEFEPSVPRAKEIHNAAVVYLAIRRLLKKHDTDMITANCGGGLGTSGELRGFPCLGFAQLLDDGGLGICEAGVDDTPPMLMARLLAGRPGFVSDPAIDTSQNRIVYSHCVGSTKVFGPGGRRNGYHIRTSHARVGTVVESLMPAGYMITTFHTNVEPHKQMIIHQAEFARPAGQRERLPHQTDRRSARRHRQDVRPLGPIRLAPGDGLRRPPGTAHRVRPGPGPGGDRGSVTLRLGIGE